MKPHDKEALHGRADAKRSKRRDELIKMVNDGIRDVGNALMELRDDEHWKDTHSSFSDFCRDNFEISKTYLYDTIKALELIASLPKSVRPKITNERQARALISIPEKARVDVILDCEQNGGITAENILAHVKKTTPKSKPSSPPLADSTFTETTESEIPSKTKTKTDEKPKVKGDDVGTPVPTDALPFWIRQKDVKKVLKTISSLRVAIKEARDGGDFLWVKHGQEAYEYLSRAYSYITDASPDCVCLVCQGSPTLQPQGCNTCGSTGMISQYRFDHFLPKELREIRLKSNAEYAKTHQLDNVR